MNAKIVIDGELHSSGLKLLNEYKKVELIQIQHNWEESLLPIINEIDAILLRTNRLGSELILKMKNLKVVSRHGVGYDNVDLQTLSSMNIPLTIVGDEISQTVAEHAFMLTIVMAKNLLKYDQSVRKGSWHYRNSQESMDLFGKNLLIIGLGKIGIKYASLAKAFGMKISAFDPFVSMGIFKNNNIKFCDDLHEGLKEADIISLHTPKPKKPIIGENEFKILKKNSILVNTSRGNAIDEKYLIHALNDCRIKGAALDVFMDEPLSLKSKLITNDKTILTPHSSSLTKECSERMAIKASQNIIDFFEKTLDSDVVVNFNEINYINKHTN